ncbi:MAG: sigma 54-interacting transcriptional regulator [Desulfomonilaceae bacterium]
MKKIRILLVEDNAVDALRLKKDLAKANQTNFTISHVETLAEATDRLQKEEFNIVVLDLALPDSRGIETLLAVKNLISDVPVMILSGLDDEALAIEAVQKGAQDYLLKGKWDGSVLARSISLAIARKRVEKALRETQQRFELALTGADLGWWDWNIQTDEAFVNERGAAILGYTVTELEPNLPLWKNLMYPDDAALNLQMLQEHLQGRTQMFETEHRLRTKAGEWKWILARGRVVERDSSGNPLRMAGTFLDTTDRKMAEQALIQSEERFRAIFEGVEDPIFLKDRSRRYIQVNLAFERLAGVPASEIIGKKYKDLFGAETADYIKSMELRVLEGETIEDEHRNTIRGVPMILLATRTPLRDHSGQIIGILTILHDITDRKKFENPPVAAAEDYPSAAMRLTLGNARIAAKRGSTIILTGESGSGKDHLAKYIHEHSDRANGPYFSINCAAIASELAESELFGHEKGSFTGAIAKKRGMLELAEGGTLLLNEIGELSLPLQAKLLTFLDTKKFTRVGGEKIISVSARLIAATNTDLEKAVEEGAFRKDLFYRINVLSIHVPPLRERKDDLPILVHEILAKIADDMQLHKIPLVDPAVVSALRRYDWPGNVRELRNLLERAVILSGGKVIDPAHLGLEAYKKQSPAFPSEPGSLSGTLQESINSLTRTMCVDALRSTGGNRRSAALRLGISRDTLYRYIQNLGIKKEDYM